MSKQGDVILATYLDWAEKQQDAVLYKKQHELMSTLDHYLDIKWHRLDHENYFAEGFDFAQFLSYIKHQLHKVANSYIIEDDKVFIDFLQDKGFVLMEKNSMRLSELGLNLYHELIAHNEDVIYKSLLEAKRIWKEHGLVVDSN